MRSLNTQWIKDISTVVVIHIQTKHCFLLHITCKRTARSKNIRRTNATRNKPTSINICLGIFADKHADRAVLPDNP